jgi:hypothetical protein
MQPAIIRLKIRGIIKFFIIIILGFINTFIVISYWFTNSEPIVLIEIFGPENIS